MDELHPAGRKTMARKARDLATTRCGCHYRLGDGETEHQAWDNGAIVYCPLHAAAPALLRALQRVIARIDVGLPDRSGAKGPESFVDTTARMLAEDGQDSA